MKAVLQIFAVFVAAFTCLGAEVPVSQEERSAGRRLASKTKAPTAKSTKAPSWNPTATASAAPSSCEPDLLVDISIAASGDDRTSFFHFIDLLTNTTLKNFTGFDIIPVTDSFPIPVNGCTKLAPGIGVIGGEDSGSAIASVVIAGASFFEVNVFSPPMFFGLGCTRRAG